MSLESPPNFPVGGILEFPGVGNLSGAGRSDQSLWRERKQILLCGATQINLCGPNANPSVWRNANPPLWSKILLCGAKILLCGAKKIALVFWVVFGLFLGRFFGYFSSVGKARITKQNHTCFWFWREIK